MSHISSLNMLKHLQLFVIYNLYTGCVDRVSLCVYAFTVCLVPVNKSVALEWARAVMNTVPH
jgi:hypothetical protein